METYDGPARVTADGEEHEVTVQLTVTSDRGLQGGRGSLQAHDEEAAWKIREADLSKLRIDNREGYFIPMSGQLGSEELGIKGSGPAPFGD